MKTLLLTLAACTLFVSLALADPATFTWSEHPGPIAGFKIYDTVNPGVYGAPVATITPGTATSHTMEIAQKTDATRHYFTITAFKDSGVESLKSNEVSKLISALPVIVVLPKPLAPVLTLSNITETSAEVSWLPVDDGTGKSALVNVRLSLASTPYWGSMDSLVCPSSPCTIPVLPGKQYRLQAVAWRAETPKNIFGPFSESVSFTTPDSPPGEPKGLTVTKATTDEIIISSLVVDCPIVRTSTKNSNGLINVRTINCIKDLSKTEEVEP